MTQDRGGGSSRRRDTTLPTKVCVACGRPFTWRKKWERCWEQVRYCSDRCRQAGTSGAERILGPPDRHPPRSGR